MIGEKNNTKAIKELDFAKVIAECKRIISHHDSVKIRLLLYQRASILISTGKILNSKERFACSVNSHLNMYFPDDRVDLTTVDCTITDAVIKYHLQIPS